MSQKCPCAYGQEALLLLCALPYIGICAVSYTHLNIYSVIMIGSASGHTGSEFPEYAASKGGVLAYTKNAVSYTHLMNTLTFGQISKMFEFLPQNMQGAICQDFGNVKNCLLYTSNSLNDRVFCRQPD